MNEKLSQDRYLTNRKKFHNKALPGWLVLHTWSGDIENEACFPENWLKCNGVLVGIPDPPRSREPHTVTAAGWWQFDDTMIWILSISDADTIICEARQWPPGEQRMYDGSVETVGIVWITMFPIRTNE
ncbi:uncharacterized protein EI90DRAFT_3042603 [Cantharellus anzutake]|uniref:uncharacterized protein n=1 Tax=Cantharellus anzutake TaxID=1750568 RepID=UPI001904A261|nr:uncharacterized protein EI90DRAFT_3042603 [Cantharellus anzutake]KAF8337331.1 hypothetical protein EI90DRAFT_3042603 [Cantharellus anzutake]